MLCDELELHLTEKILPCWKMLADEKYGGFYGYVDKELNVYHEVYKGCILNSRILWAFATTARVLGNEHFLTYAKRAYAFLKKFEDKANDGVYWLVTHDGKPLDLTKHTYCQAFAIYGLAAYSRATGLQELLDKAMRSTGLIWFFMLCIRCDLKKY